RLEQEPEPLTLAREAAADGWRRELPHERRPRAQLGALPQAARALRVVELEDGRLLVDPGRAQARRVQRVAFDLGGPALMALHQQADAVPVERHRGGVPACDPGRDVLRPPRVRQDALARRLDAAARTGEREA